MVLIRPDRAKKPKIIDKDQKKFRQCDPVDLQPGTILLYERDYFGDACFAQSLPTQT